jgi:hypothetical protein
MSSNVTRILGDVSSQRFSHGNCRYEVGQKFHHARVDWTGKGPYINLAVGVGGPLKANPGEVHNGQMVAVEIARFEFRPYRNDFYVTFILLKPEDLASKQTGGKPALATPGTSPLQAVLQELGAKIEGANTARALTDLASPLKRASTRFSAAQIRPALDKWVAKSADIIGFYLDAYTALKWTQEAVRQYEEMSELVTQLNLLQPRPDKGEPRKWKLPPKGPTT